MKNYEVLEQNGKFSLVVWINEESFIYLKKEVSLGDLLNFTDSIKSSIETFVANNLKN